MPRKIIHTDKAPQAIGTYSQAVQSGNTVYLSGQIPLVNQVMADYFETPYPARAAVGVASLPKDAQVEMDAILVFND